MLRGTYENRRPITEHLWLPIVVVTRELMTIEDLLLSAHGDQLLSIATSYLVGNNREIDVSDIL